MAPRRVPTSPTGSARCGALNDDPLRGPGQSGFTLIELLISVVVIGILAGIVVFGVVSFRNDANNSADLANLKILNNASAAYEAAAAPGNGLNDLPSDIARMNALFDRGFITGNGDGNRIITPKVAGRSFVWNSSIKQWQYLDTAVQGYDLASSTISPTDFKTIGTWTNSGQGFTATEGRLFVPNARTDYAISVTATLAPGAPYGGYGIFFNTTITPSLSDTGYILQFDRGIDNNHGAIVIRSRTNGKEADPPVATYNSGSTGGLVPDRTVNSGWWSAQHNLVLTVTSTSSTGRNLSFQIDGQQVFGNFSFTGPATPSTNQTGFRSWNWPTTYSNLTLTGS
ncbi:MAG: prepilin-type N-terminal cleavage/methylation domain-containing protein [Actinomycetes bacterium]